jgi:hypothetical protein
MTDRFPTKMSKFRTPEYNTVTLSTYEIHADTFLSFPTPEMSPAPISHFEMITYCLFRNLEYTQKHNANKNLSIYCGLRAKCKCEDFDRDTLHTENHSLFFVRLFLHMLCLVVVTLC